MAYLSFSSEMNGSAERTHRKAIVISICQEYSWKVEEAPKGRIIVFAHEKWRLPLEDRIRPHGWRYAKINKWGDFRILVLVDSYR